MVVVVGRGQKEEMAQQDIYPHCKQNTILFKSKDEKRERERERETTTFKQLKYAMPQ